MLILLRQTILFYFLVLLSSEQTLLQINGPTVVKWTQKVQDNTLEKHTLLIYGSKTEQLGKLKLIDKLPVDYSVNNCQIIPSIVQTSLYKISQYQKLQSLSYIHKINGVVQETVSLTGKNYETNLVKIKKTNQETETENQALLKHKLFFIYQRNYYQIDSRYYSPQPKCYYLSELTSQLVCQYACKVITIQNIVKNVQLPFYQISPHQIHEYETNNITYNLQISQSLQIELKKSRDTMSELNVQQIQPKNGSVFCQMTRQSFELQFFIITFACRNLLQTYSMAKIKVIGQRNFSILFNKIFILEPLEKIDFSITIQKGQIQCVISDDQTQFRTIHQKQKDEQIDAEQKEDKSDKVATTSEQQISHGLTNLWIYIIASILIGCCLILVIFVACCKLCLWKQTKKHVKDYILSQLNDLSAKSKDSVHDMQSSRHLQDHNGIQFSMQAQKKQKCITSASTASSLPQNPRDVSYQKPKTPPTFKKSVSLQVKPKTQIVQTQQSMVKQIKRLEDLSQLSDSLDIENPEEIDYPNRRCRGNCSIILEPKQEESSYSQDQSQDQNDQ